MCKTTESVKSNFADNYDSFFNECFLMDSRLELTKDRYFANLTFLHNMFQHMNTNDFYSIAEKKKFVAELISSIKECQSCISRLSTKIQQLNDLTDADYK